MLAAILILPAAWKLRGWEDCQPLAVHFPLRAELVNQRQLAPTVSSMDRSVSAEEGCLEETHFEEKRRTGQARFPVC
jgi:hypothetical protein